MLGLVGMWHIVGARLNWFPNLRLFFVPSSLVAPFFSVSGSLAPPLLSLPAPPLEPDSLLQGSREAPRIRSSSDEQPGSYRAGKVWLALTLWFLLKGFPSSQTMVSLAWQAPG